MNDTNWSVPETEVLQSASDLLEADRRGVLATIIAVEGSAYRRPGAKMVIPEDGGGIGHITAGCLEDEVQRLAREVLETGERIVQTYDLRPEEDDDVWGLGVGCNGVLDILLEPLDESVMPILNAFESGRDIGALTVVDAADDTLIGTRAYFDPREVDFTESGGIPPDILDALRDPSRELTARGKADLFSVGDVDVFVDGVQAPPTLVVIGTGHDVGPIVELGKQADFRVSVVGFRGAAARSERFPEADSVTSTAPVRIRETVDFDMDTYVVVATHNFLDDRLAIDELVKTPVPYIGLMGPRDRFETMLEDFAEEGRTFEAHELARIYTPVGLDLGGGSPHQIALSIVAEILAIANEREPQHLKEREGTIHERLSISPDD